MATIRPATRSGPIRNAMTVDVEDYFQVQAFAHCIPRQSWDAWIGAWRRTPIGSWQQFGAAGIKATFLPWAGSPSGTLP